MNTLGWQHGLAAVGLGFFLAVSGCDDNSDKSDKNGTGGSLGSGGQTGTGGTSATGGQGGTGTGGQGGQSTASQTPPEGATAVEAWLATGAYKQWHCEPALHASRDPSPHGFNRICSNDLVAATATGTTAWPKGAAAVKELFAKATDTTPGGYAVYLKTDTDSAAGANWYWYERLPATTSPVADGRGDSGAPKTICVGCHAAAGSDTAHTPSAGGRDEVYTPVP